MRKRKITFTAEEDTRLRQMVADKMSIPQMAKAIDRPYNQVRNALDRLGLKASPSAVWRRGNGMALRSFLKAPSKSMEPVGEYIENGQKIKVYPPGYAIGVRADLTAKASGPRGTTCR